MMRGVKHCLVAKTYAEVPTNATPYIPVACSNTNSCIGVLWRRAHWELGMVRGASSVLAGDKEGPVVLIRASCFCLECAE